MSDRYRGYLPPGRSATYNPARSSLPSSIGYSTMLAGDVATIPSSSRHPSATPRGYSTSTSASGVPTTTRTYAVRQDPRNSRPVVRDGSRSRRSTLDSTQSRPVIITTTQKDGRYAGSSSHSSNTRSGSPLRDDYRTGDGLYYSQPATSMRSNSSARPYLPTSYNDSYPRTRDAPRERSDSLMSSREADAYRNSRPSVTYPSDPRHSNAAVDYGDDDVSYTNAGELALYDLEHTRPIQRSRRDSYDRGYHRPSLDYNTDQRSFNITDSGRAYNPNTSRPYEGGREGGRGGPPPSTRGFDKLHRAYDGPPRDAPPVAPAPPTPTSSAPPFDGPPPERREIKRGGPRPVSLYQESAPRSSHHEDFYRSREDERTMRELRDRDRESGRMHEPPAFLDDGIGSRGFGIRTDTLDSAGSRRDSRLSAAAPEPRKRSDEDIARVSDPERDDRRHSRQDSRTERRGRRESKRGSDEDERDRSRFRDKVASGLGIVGGAVGLSSLSSSKDKDKDKEKVDDRGERDEREPRRRRSPDDRREPRKPSEERRKEREPERRLREESRDARDSPRQTREPGDAKPNGDFAVASGSDSDEARRSSRRRRSSAPTFNPNDTGDLKQLKEQLAAMNSSEKSREKGSPAAAAAAPPPPPAAADQPRTRSSTPPREPVIVEKRAESRGRRADSRSRSRDASVPAQPSRQVRVVSPPRDKDADKPLRGILKQPKVSFPEDKEHIREGVAPHKDDKKAKDAPAGARWTKISRKIVNPEALTIGKERFEVRDDFVIVLRVLNKEEIQAYASATQVLRERRKKGEDAVPRDRERDRDSGRDRDREGHRSHHRDDSREYDEDEADREKRSHHHHHHHHKHHDDEDGELDERDRDRDRDRRRRHHRRDDEDEYEPRPKALPEPAHHRSFRERDRSLADQILESVTRV